MILVGCTSDEVAVGENSSWKVSPYFKTNDRSLQGTIRKIGILGPQIKAQEVSKQMWHFWGEETVLRTGNLKIIAINKETKEEVQVLIKNAGTPNEQKVWEYGELGGPNNGADAHLPSNISFPYSGIWKLNAFIGGTLFESIVVEVK
jgi:hypothetical protein